MLKKTPSKFILHAPNVHTGGGGVLLNMLLETLLKKQGQVLLHLDSRFIFNKTFPGNIAVKYFKPHLMGRLLAERDLKRAANYEDHVLCFGNLPPLHLLRAKTSVYIQNTHLLEKLSFKKLSIRHIARIGLQKCWLKSTSSHATQFLVQTPSMKKKLFSYLSNARSIEIKPFWDPSDRPPQKKKNIDFLYVATPEQHKNHRELLNAWVLLAKNNCYPSLCLTVDKNSSLWEWIENLVIGHNLNVRTTGYLPHNEVNKLYARAKALIYPSLTESFGLPLLEAAHAGLPVLASNLDYVGDLLQSVINFDPGSADSICEAVIHYIKDKPSFQSELRRILTSDEFLMDFSV